MKYRGGKFIDVTRSAGIPPQPWGTSAAFSDLDSDGFLDLFVCYYVEFGPKSPEFCLVRGIRNTCGPGVYASLRSAVYRNLGGSRFEDVTVTWGVLTSGNSLGAAITDIDGAGGPEIAVANGVKPGDLFQKRTGRRFRNCGVESGTALPPNGRPHAGNGD